MKMKKVVAMLLALTMVFGMVACGTKAEEAAPEESVETEAPAEELLAGETTSGSASAETVNFKHEGDEPIKIGYVCYDYTLEIWAQITAALEETCKSYGWEITSVTCENNAEQQVMAFENFIQAGVDGIIASCENSESVVDVTKQALEAGIPVVSLFYPYDEVLTYSTVDLYDTGYAAGKSAAEYINENITDHKAKVAIFDWPYNSALIDRAQGMLTGLSENVTAEYEIVTTQYADTEDKGLVAMETILQAYDDIDVVLALSSSSLIGAITALESAEVPEDAIALFACDTTRNVLEPMQQGKYMYGTSTYGNAHQMADPAAELMKEILETGNVPEPNMLECFMIDRSTVDSEIGGY